MKVGISGELIVVLCVKAVNERNLRESVFYDVFHQ